MFDTIVVSLGLGNLGSAVLSATANNPTNKLASDQIMHSFQLPGMQHYPGIAIIRIYTKYFMLVIVPGALPAQSQYGRYIHQKQREGIMFGVTMYIV